ncbi:MAG TPA: DUF805 domain-containing protein [Devosia sp.]|jgi:uncharacterized membrane protein YhaH (DUF805 family)|uniref:DUF805 domain-containing protein n=1 Tax=Devosia sp. TaxID=1871048 RepID=UPI002DDCBF08|nr:DUF805 domain-containing protein [Devosia sp.]HEV2515037.1 DUF805 domain-containing protein [Devosia sp.]
MFGYFDTMLRYFEFAGRSSRTQYWVYMLVMTALFFAALYVDYELLGYFRRGVSSFGPLTLFCIFIHIIPNITVTVRRLHDSGRSGWWYWISLVPFIGGIWLLVLMFLGPDGYGANDYGDDPRESTWAAPRAKAVKLTRAQEFVAAMDARKRDRRPWSPSS